MALANAAQLVGASSRDRKGLVTLQKMKEDQNGTVGRKWRSEQAGPGEPRKGSKYY